MKIFAVICLALFAFGCQKAEEAKVETNSAAPTKTISEAKTEKPMAALPVDVPNLVNKTESDFEKIFGKPIEVGVTLDEGKYRLYQVANEPKGLAARFYGGKAKSFNLIFSKPTITSKEALRKVFNIDVGNNSPIKDSEPLTEKYQGTFNGVKFSKVSAKKTLKKNEFIFVLAEVTR
jgi:hypothetical protein